MKNSTAKVLFASAIILYVIGIIVSLTALFIGNINLMLAVPVLALMGIVLVSLPEVDAENRFYRILNPNR